MPEREPAILPLYSRTRPGSISLGWVGRLITSVLVILATWFAYMYVMPFFVLRVFGAAGFGLYLLFAVPVVIYVLVRVWRRQRVG